MGFSRGGACTTKKRDERHLLLDELEGEVVFVFNELIFAPIAEVVVATECERPE